ncbi:hypothetical protein MARVELLAND_129 [Bacillus phage vB_BspM_MarvelLand]|nr:hypothetical protein MARVELLAND_129 [Bacillus phage vB_BspM_MarvelLand]
MKVKTIVIPNRNERLFREGQLTETVTVEWNCPTCGKEMPEPHLETLEDSGGVPYKVHKWLNECYHILCYDELKEVEGESK